MMTIGMFARASLLSVKALRAYHESGILVPAEIDPTSGYRRYHPGQLADAKLIRRLRDLDLPLAEVAQVVDARDPDVTAEILDHHRRRMDERLASVQRIVDDLVAADAEPAASTPVHRRRLDHGHALARRGAVAPEEFPAFLGAAYAALGEAQARFDLSPAGPPGALYAAELHEGPTDPVTAYLPVAPAPTLPAGSLEGLGLELIEIPAVTAAVAVHVGGYDTIGDTYADLGAWVALEAMSTGEPVREVYLVSYGDAEPGDFRTQICWPVRP